MAISSVLGSSALLPAGLGFRNKIINGAMAISQRGTSAISNAAATNTYGTDRWHIYGSSASKMTITQSTTNPTGQGFSNSTLVTSSAATTPGSGDYYGVRQYIEGYNVADLAWGTSGAKPVVVSFWVRSSIAGTYSLALHNASSDRSLVSTYTISAVDTWEKKTIYINAGDVTGTWGTGTGIGVAVWFDLGSGTSANGTAGTWTAGLPTRTSGSVNWVGTSGATFYITGVQLEQNLQPTPFEQRPYGAELALCQRYYQRVTAVGATGIIAKLTSLGVQASTTTASFVTLFSPAMRSAPTMSGAGAEVSDDTTFASVIYTLSIANATGLTGQVIATHGAAGATNRPTYIRASNNNTAYIDYSAEL
jgi:hypothetical protein